MSKNISTLKPFQKHLELIGYAAYPQTNTNSVEVTLFKHKRETQFILMEEFDGICYRNCYTSNENVENNKIEYLGFINELNMRSVFIKFHCTPDDSSLFLKAWSPKVYSRTTFGNILSMIDYNVETLLDHNPNTQKFLS